MKLTTAAIHGMLTAAAAAGCGPGHPGAASSSPTATPTVSATSPSHSAAPFSGSSPGSQPATAPPVPASSSAPSESPPSASPPPVPGVTYPGVIADCTGAPPQQLSIRPTTIMLTCADAGLGVQGLTWTRWGVSAATGQGTVWEHVCTPSCAASGTYAYYPVAVTLARVRSSAYGKWFSQLTVGWLGKPPPSPVPAAFPLDAPSR